MQTTLLSAFVLALCGLVGAPRAEARAAFGQGTPPPQSDPKWVATQALLTEAFKGLEEELKAALVDFQSAQKDARDRGLPREAYPQSPTPEFFPRFEQLALQDQADALRWCVGSLSMMALPIDESNARKENYYRRLVTIHPNAPFIRDVVQFLGAEFYPAGLGLDRTLPLLDHLIAQSRVPGVASAALLAKATAYQKSVKPEHKPLYKKTIEELVQRFPLTEEGKRAKGQLFQLEHLQVGMVAPEFKTTDVDGVEFKLSDYRGKVVVIDFWGFWCANCVAMIPHEKEMVERLKNEPFALIGIATDPTKEEFRRRVKDSGITWRNSWQGSAKGPLCTEWGISSFPAIFVLDAKGVIRNTGVRGAELSKAVDLLLAEQRAASAPKDKPSEPAGQGPDKKGG